MSTTAFARTEWDEREREDPDTARRDNEVLARLLEVAKREREDSGDQCIKCGNRDPETLIEDDPCRVPIFKCLVCRTSWFDVRNRRGDAQCDWQCDDERDAS